MSYIEIIQILASDLNRGMLSDPGSIILCSDDGAIAELLVELGISGTLNTKGGGRPDWTQFVGVLDHPTHWLCIARHSGYTKPADNGYQLLALPKAYIGEAEADARFNVMMKHQFKSGSLPARQWIDAHPRHN